MENANFEVLKVHASICPQASGWPKPDWSRTHLGDPSKGILPHVESGNPHWSAIHECVDYAREHTLKTLGALQGIDADKKLSPAGKADAKLKFGTKALAALKQSEHLSKAQRAVSEQCARWDKEIGLQPKEPSAADAMMRAEVRAFLASMSKSAERVAFINSNLALGDPDILADAVLSAPPWLSGLSPAELAVVRQRVAATRNPEIAKARADTEEALAVVERGWRAASNQIREAAGIEKPVGAN